MGRPVGLLTIDLEDYRRQELRDHRRGDEPPHSDEVERQLDTLLGVLSDCDVRATVFSVGRLATELPHRVWREIVARHYVACHGYEHMRVQYLGKRGFVSDLWAAKNALEDVSGQQVVSYRAPYFSGELCDPWYGDALARVGFVLDSSRRLRSTPPAFAGTFSLAGSGGAVREVPLPSIGFGSKRFTIIGGTYFRLLPLHWIIGSLEWGRAQGFIPIVYLHPYDLDPTAAPLEYEWFQHWSPRLGDLIRRLGRSTAEVKLRALARLYEFRPVESLIAPGEIALFEPFSTAFAGPNFGPATAHTIPLSGEDGVGIEVGDPNGAEFHVA